MTAPRFGFLGTSGALASAARDNTSLVFEADGAAVLADCGGAAMQRLQRLGVDPLALTHVVVTHLHVDHSYGLPSLLRQQALMDRKTPLLVVCRPEHVEALRTVLTVFNVWQRAGMFETALAPIDLAVGARAFTAGAVRVTTAPTEHGSMPTFAVRVDVEGRAVVYSSDTQPCDAVAALARGADTLVHEATFAERDRAASRYAASHSSAADAGQIAARAGVGRLILTHIGAEYHDDVGALAAEAGRHFAGPVEIAEEGRLYSF